MTEDNASASASADDYGDLLDDLDVAIEEARKKIDSGRVYDAENEKVRIKWIRALAYAANVRRQVMNDRDLQELSERLERLEEAQGVSDGDVPQIEA